MFKYLTLEGPSQMRINSIPQAVVDFAENENYLQKRYRNSCVKEGLVEYL
jgi:hypothetical protein